MLRVTNKSIALTIFMISLSMILAAYLLTFSYRNHSTLYLEDMQGDRSALSDLLISGYLQDYRHAQKFEIINGKLQHQFIYYDTVNDVKMSPVKYGNGASDGEYVYWYQYDYKVSPDANTRVEHTENKIQLEQNDGTIDATEEITTTYADKADVYMSVRLDLADRRSRKSLPDKNRLQFKTGVYLKSTGMDFAFINKKTHHSGASFSEQERFENKNDVIQRYGNALAVIDGKPYFTVLTDKRYKGMNGIFTAKEYAAWFPGSDKGSVNTISSFSLDENKTEVLGLHAVDGKLAMVLLVDNVLTFKAYDLHSGALISELAVDEFKLSGEKFNYDPYINGNTLSLNITTQQENINRLTIVSVRVDDTITLLHNVNTHEYTGQIVQSVPCITPVKDKLAVIAVIHDIDTNVKHTGLYPKHFILLVFDSNAKNNNLLYQGEIITDANEDNIMYTYKSEGSYDHDHYRHLSHVTVRGN